MRSRRTVTVDAALYLVFAIFAGGSALWSQFYGYRLWGDMAFFAYLFGFGQAIWLAVRPGATVTAGRFVRLLRSRYTPIGLVTTLGMIVPLAVLLVERTRGQLWSEQPEVWVIERSASLLLRHGTPYTNLATLHRPPVADDYTPYGPPMTLFGMPRALLGDGPLTDARAAFAIASALLGALVLRVLTRPRIPVRAAQLMIACPLVALTWSVAGDDLPIVALMMLAFALLQRRRPAWCGAVIAVAASMKFISSPALIVLGVAVAITMGGKALARFAAAALGVGGLLTVPVLLVDPASFVEHVIRFPIGLGRAHSPAESPLPGNLLSRLGPAGHTTSLMLLAIAAVGIAGWLAWRPPRCAADAARHTAVGLAAAVLLAPTTRYGYLLYPIALWGMAITLRAAAWPPAPSTPPPSRPVTEQLAQLR